MEIHLTPVEESEHLGMNYESYIVYSDHKHIGRILEKSLTDNSLVYDVQLYDENGKDTFIIIGAQNLDHAESIIKAIEND